MGEFNIGYGRVSTSSGEQLSALEGQLRWLAEQGCEPILHDVESGLNVDRADYGQLLTRFASGRGGVVRATRADRLGRDAPELVRLVQACDRAGVTVVTRDDGRLSARTAEELLLLYVRAALAQGESMKISQRVCAGLEQGRSIGKPMRKLNVFRRL
jgi:DNA invertase Pin-like site-specific DNA recombinase